jgi:hypothetical protein
MSGTSQESVTQKRPKIPKRRYIVEIAVKTDQASFADLKDIVLGLADRLTNKVFLHKTECGTKVSKVSNLRSGAIFKVEACAGVDRGLGRHLHYVGEFGYRGAISFVEIKAKLVKRPIRWHYLEQTAGAARGQNRDV